MFDMLLPVSFSSFTTSLLSVLQKRRQAEAINGALAVIGLTAALVLEGRTGKGILGQLAGYLAALSSLFGQ